MSVGDFGKFGDSHTSGEGLARERVVAVSASPEHGFTKKQRERIRLLAGLGVEGDGHLGDTVQHRSRVAADPTQPNLRQVHLIHRELHDELNANGFSVFPGALGENITTSGIQESAERGDGEHLPGLQRVALWPVIPRA